MIKAKKAMNALATVMTMAGVLTLAGCGGGSDASETASQGPSPEGVYAGTISGATAGAFQMLVLEDGSMWALYGVQGTSTFFVQGFLQGPGSWSQGTYSSADIRDFGATPAYAGRLSASFDSQARTISGTASSSTGTASFSGGPIAGSLYRYETPASLAQAAGRWTLTELGGSTLTLDVGSDGRYAARTVSGCTFSGALTPRRSGKNVFDMSLTFGATPCPLPQQAATGIALVTPMASGQHQLLVAVTDAARTVGTAAFGTR